MVIICKYYLIENEKKELDKQQNIKKYLKLYKIGRWYVKKLELLELGQLELALQIF